MDETISPMIEMADTHHVASDRYNVSQGSTTSTDYGDEFIQDFRLSVAVPVLPVVEAQQTAFEEQTTFMREMHGHTKGVINMAIYTPSNNDPALLITCGEDNIALVWNLETYQVVRRLEGVHTHRIRGLAIYTPENGSTGNNNTTTALPKLTDANKSNLPGRVLVVTGSDDKTAAVWDLLTGELIRHLQGGHRWFIISVSIHMPTYGTSPFVVTSGWDNYSVVWNLLTGKQVLRLASGHANAVSSVLSFVSPQLQVSLGRNLMESARMPFILTVGFDKIISIWDGETGQLLRSYPTKHTDIVSSLAVFTPPPSENGLYALTGSFDHTAISWDLITGEPIRILNGHTDWVTSVAMFRTNSGKPFFAMGLTGCQDGTAILWDLVHGIAVRKFEGVHKHPVTSVRFVPRSHAQGSSSLNAYDENLRNCSGFYPVSSASSSSASTGAGHADDKMSEPAPVKEDKFSRHFPYILTSSEDQRVILWNLDSHQSRQLSATDEPAPPSGYDPRNRAKNTPSQSRDWIVSLKIFAPEDGRRPVLISGSTNATVTLWDLLSNQVIRVLDGVHTADISGVDVFESGHARFLDTKYKKNGLEKKKHNHSNTATLEYTDYSSLIPCGSTSEKVLLVVSGSFDCTAVVWDFDTGEAVSVLKSAHSENISSIAVSEPFGAMQCAFLVTCSYDSTATVWDLHSDTILHNLANVHTDGITNCTIFKPLLPSAHTAPYLITTGIDGTAVVWDIHKGAHIRTLSGGHTERVKSVTTYQCKLNKVQPMVITGGYDKRTIVWDLYTGKIVRILSGVHKNWVTAVSVVAPKDSGQPFLVTGGFDGVPVIWDFLEGKMICKLEGGHSSGVRAIAVYSGVSGDSGRYSPLVFSAGHDGYITQWDSLYPFQSMPPKSSVMTLFHLDLAEHVDKLWPRISALSERYGQCLWMENSHLFMQAVVLRRSDFLNRFQHMLGVMLPRMGNIIPKDACIINGSSVKSRQVDPSSTSTETHYTMLHFAIAHKDLQTTRVLLKVWIRLLNTPIHNIMSIKVHPSMYLPTSEILLLGKVYPAEFTEFIRALRLVRVDLNTCMSGVIDPSTKSITAGCSLQTVSDPYKQFDVHVYGTEDSKGQPVSLSYLPLHAAASLKMLQMYMQASIALSSVEIFDTDVVIFALRFAWKHFAHYVHMMACAQFALFLIIYTPTILNFEELVYSADGSKVVFGWFLQSVTFACVLLRIVFSVAKVRAVIVNEEWVAFVSDPWVVLDSLTQALAAAGLLTRYGVLGENDVSRSLLSLATILLWFRGLYYLRPFRASGPLVSMVLAIAMNMRVFSVIMLIALFGFSQGFWLLSHRGEHLPFGTIDKAMLSAFNYMMGSFDTQFEGNRVPLLSTLLVVVFAVFMIILMLNLLIALMGNTFSSVSEKGLAQWRQEQVSIVLDEKFLVGAQVPVPPCLYVLMNSTDYEEYVETRDMQDGLMQDASSSSSSGGSDGILNAAVMRKIQNLEHQLESLANKLDLVARKMV